MSHFGIIGAFLNAGIANKIIFIMLALLSIYSWGLILRKYFELKKYQAVFAVFMEAINTQDLNIVKVYIESHANVYSQTMQLLIRQLKNHSLERLISQGEIVLYSSVVEVESKIYKLAIITNAAPFIGLLGTVIGVINSFNNIALQASVSLATIAPGIAESLYATALGLFVSIPAMIAYNIFTAKLEGYKESFSEIVEKLIFLLAVDEQDNDDTQDE